jgi:hypothetical protein
VSAKKLLPRSSLSRARRSLQHSPRPATPPAIRAAVRPPVRAHRATARGSLRAAAPRARPSRAAANGVPLQLLRHRGSIKGGACG